MITVAYPVHQLTKNSIGYPSRVFKEHITTDRIVLQPKTWRPEIIELFPFFDYTDLIACRVIGGFSTKS
jgi:hypothetical protein